MEEIHAHQLSRFWSKVNKTNSCWVWTAGLNSNNGKGYGQFYLNGKKVKSHRLSYEITIGKIPDGMVLDHLCRNRQCVNPDHLEPVTNRENVLRGDTHSSGHNRAKTHCPSGHEYSEENTRLSKSGYRKCKTCHRLWEAERRKRV